MENMDKIDNINENNVAEEEIKPRGNIEAIDPRTGIVHFFETEEERIAFLEEQRDPSNN